MGIMKKLGKSGMFGLAGLAATEKGALNKIARNGGLGLMGMALAKKKKAAQPGRPMMDEVMVAEEAPAGAPMMRKGGKVKKMAKGGSASKRADGCATQGKTRGKFV
jgi:hypothetical protein